MSSSEMVQSESGVGRRTFDWVLVAFVVAVLLVLALAGAGVL